MAVSFTSEEIEKIKKQRKKPDERPEYYSIANKGNLQISEDFEGYLILQPASQKQSILSWIKTSSEIEVDKKDRDELLERYLGIRLQDATDKVTELEEKLQDFSNFRNSLFSGGDDPSRYEDVTELGLFITSLQRPLDEINSYREQAFHEQNLAKLMQKRLSSTKSTDETQKEIQSWQVVMAAYIGQLGE